MNPYFNWSLPSLLSISELSLPLADRVQRHIGQYDVASWRLSFDWVQRYAGSWLFLTIRLALPSFDPVVTGAVIQMTLRWVVSAVAALK